MSTTLPQRVDLHSAHTRGVALLWEFAEATPFVVITYVRITWVALRPTRAAMAASGWAVTGALVGGALTYRSARRDAAGVLEVFDGLPAIGSALVARVAEQLQALGVCSLMAGPFTGAPYKLYAAQAPAAAIGFREMLAIGISVPGLRLVLLRPIFAAAVKWAVPRFCVRSVRACWLVFWLLNDALYWSVMPN